MAQISEDARRQLLRSKLDAKRQSEKKSLQSVEALLEKKVTELQLLDHCNNLWQQSYQDCTEERALLELCGYPLCDNQVAPQTKKLPTYKISLRNNKVYSNAEHRIFCSVQCHEHSKWLKSQLSVVPLWQLETSYRKKISLHRSREYSHADANLDGNLIRTSPRISVNEIERISQDLEDVPSGGCPVESVRESRICEPPAQEPQRLNHAAPPPRDSANSEIFAVDKIEKLLCEWFTIESLHHIVGRDRFLELRAQHDHGVTGPDRSLDDMMVKYFRLCTFLDQQEKLDGITYSDEEDETTAKEDPDSSGEGTKTAGRKPKRKKVTFKPDANPNKSERLPDCDELSGTREAPEPVLPPVDKHHQELLREKILLEKLSPLVETTSSLMQTSTHILAKDVSQLIRTFRLTRENCLVHDDEMVVVFVAIMMLLDRKAGGEGQVPQDIRPAFEAAIRSAGLTWGDITLILRKATNPQRIFNPQGNIMKESEGS